MVHIKVPPHGKVIGHIDPHNLTPKQKEIYNRQIVAGHLARFGFNCIKLDDDWQGADFLAYHFDGETTLRVQLKARVTIDQKYRGKDVWMCFPIYKRTRGGWFLVPHDELLAIVGECTGWLNTQAWTSGNYSSGNPPVKLMDQLLDYRIAL